MEGEGWRNGAKGGDGSIGKGGTGTGEKLPVMPGVDLQPGEPGKEFASGGGGVMIPGLDHGFTWAPSQGTGFGAGGGGSHREEQGTRGLAIIYVPNFGIWSETG